MFSSDYNVLGSTVIAMNNFIQCCHCQVIQLYRLTLFFIKTLTTIISKHMVYPCVRFSDKGPCLNSSKCEQHLFQAFLVEKTFSITANVKWTVEKRRLHENHVAYRLDLIHSTCS